MKWPSFSTSRPAVLSITHAGLIHLGLIYGYCMQASHTQMSIYKLWQFTSLLGQNRHLCQRQLRLHLSSPILPAHLVCLCE